MLILLLLCLTFSLSAQYTVLDIPLYKNGNSLPNAWAGGMNLPQFSPVDLNNDGIKDLVVFDRESNVGTTYINNGTPNQVDYHFAPEYMKHIPNRDALNFMLFRDYNLDGIEDIFGMYTVWGQGVGVAIWRGSYINDTIHFEMVDEQVEYDVAGVPFPYKMFVYNSDLPAVDDIDNDGDMDILAFTLDIFYPKNVFWYKNTSVEDGHGSDSLHYILESACWGLFEETGTASIVNFGPSIDSCYNNQWFNQQRLSMQSNSIGTDLYARNGRHVGASLTTIDIDGDSIKEMFLGGVSYDNINMLSGVEINDTVLINIQDINFPSYDTPIDIHSFATTYFMDINNDGNTDLISAPSEMMVGQSIMDSVAWLYMNTTNNTSMVFDFQQKDFLVNQMLDIGLRAYPAVFDHNGDGLLDILIGTYGRPQENGTFNFGMTLLENIGTPTAPQFEWVTNNYASLDTLFIINMHPAIGDIDGDGDEDMMLGGQDGTLTYVENIGGAGQLAVWKKPMLNYKNIDVSDVSAPFLVDLDKDGDLDLVVGTFAGAIKYYQNTGTPISPNFSSVATSNDLGGFNVQDAYSQSSMPCVYNQNGAYQMYIGHYTGNFIHLDNIDNNVLGVYDTVSQYFNEFYQGQMTDMAIADLDGDSKVEYILGTSRGGIVIMTEKDTVVAIDRPIESTLRVYPNPTDNQVVLDFDQVIQGELNITVYNALGQVLLQKTFNQPQKQYLLNLTAMPSGLLFIEAQADGRRETVRVLRK